MRTIDLRQTPFSRRKAYMAISAWRKPGLFLRTIHHSTNSPLIAKIMLYGNGEESEFSSYLEHTALLFQRREHQIEFCFADEKTLLMRGSNDTGICLDFLTESGPYDYIYELEENGQHLYMANCYKNNSRYLVYLQSGECLLEQQWEESTSLYSRLRIGGKTGFLCVIKEIEKEWDKKLESYDFEESRKQTEEDFLEFYEKMPEVPVQYEEMGYMAAYLDWSAIVGAAGFLKKEAMYMSKNWMTSVWSWDHCFNAMALSYGNPGLAWDAYMVMADFQDESGRLPDSISDNFIIWNYCKPPIHGWALGRMMEHMEFSREQMTEAYAFLEKWTKWWMEYRRWDGLYYYNHGNDSGWDNATAFAVQPPVATPELQADIIVQMETLAKLAERLGRAEEAENWRKEAEDHKSIFFQKCFRADLPVAIQCSTGEVVENQSLLPYEILILGMELPWEIRKAVIDMLKSDRFQTPYGFATESPSSHLYREDGYWRGPIWASSTMILVDGLDRCGEKELAAATARKFVDMAAASGFAENFDALTGKGLRDLAYTWTASVALILAHEYLR